MNSNLAKAKKNKNDEFYTQYVDVEKELIHYKDQFFGKVVYCSCDGEGSNFVKFFKDHYDEYGLAGLLYSSIQDGVDFRSDESIELLKRSDIVCTNPPFSLFREYIAQLIEYDKKFLIIGNVNAITYKEIFPLIKDNKLWFGISISSGDREFRVPDSYPLESAGNRIDNNGFKYIRVKGVRWFTNMQTIKRQQLLGLYAKQSEKNFPKYDNYDGININKVVDIPHDYSGVMGVPITFLDKFNPAQFEMIGAMTTTKVEGYNFGYPFINKKKIYARILIKHKLIYNEHGTVIGKRGETNE